MIEMVMDLVEEDPAQNGLREFTRLLLQSAGADAGRHVTPDVMARLAREAFEFVRVKPSGERKIKLRRVETGHSANGRAGEITVVDIINDDMPFLVDSIIGEIHAREIEVKLIAHPILKAERDADGTLMSLGTGNEQWSHGQDSFIHIHLEPLADADIEELERELDNILESVTLAVRDWRAMLDRLEAAISSLERRPPTVPDSELNEAIAFLRWLDEGHFTFLGMRELRLEGDIETGSFSPAIGGGLGILRNPEVRVLRRGKELVHLTPEVRAFYMRPDPLIVTKANVVAKVHRRVHMDYIGVKTYDRDGKLTGELRIVGLFTSGAYTRAPRNIPLLRRKVEQVIADSGHPAESHSGKALLNVLETFPRDELFQISQDDLLRWSEGILDLELRPRTRALARVDQFDRFVSVLVFVPRDRYTTAVRQAIGDYLAETFKGRVSAFFPNFSQGALVRVQFIIGRYEGETPDVPAEQLERDIARIVRNWEDELTDAIGESYAAEQARSLVSRYRHAFSAGYKDNFAPVRALMDIVQIESLSDESPVAIDFYQKSGDPDYRTRVAIYRLDDSIPLSKRVPILEYLDFAVIDERSYRLKPSIAGSARDVRLHDMVLEVPGHGAIDLAQHKDRLEDTFLAVWNRRAHNDHFNRLVRAVGMTWREAAMMRAYAGYVRQIRIPYGLRYISDTLVNHIEITSNLLELFRTRFALEHAGGIEARRDRESQIVSEIETMLRDVPSLDEDRILRHFANLIRTTLRTNFYRHDDDAAGAETITFKFDSPRVENSPRPRPFAEIYVYSPRVEGVHLRGGAIARGGLRWSDRPQDFRTEVLGLAKAQQVKNAVIVPAGAKGGFVPKRLPKQGSREEVLAEGVASYQLFISSLIELTDNLDGDNIVPPERVVRHDGDDPYLVVAADKGTATFSDYANEISTSKGFWMGDAFASGGSAGYDHKQMAITARGGWEAVKRHFREMDIDIQSEPFTVIGVGDMSGDVFGNGMLLSRHIRLLAAFDHRDVFIDPDPDPAVSFKERERLFSLERSTWRDYDESLISRGGGIFSRAAKSIALTDEIRALAGLDAEQVTPSELIHALLKAQADLMWFGGIGTYVKASDEADERVGDRTNDSIRVTAAELGVKVIGEGANLGITQRARIEFAMAGGRINTDAIDNSAGVNSSDQEVNIKIALRPAVNSGAMTMEQRNEVLASMTEEVAAACLRNNYLQTLALSLGERRGTGDLGFQERLIRELERAGLLNRKIEDLPSDSEIDERAKAGRPLTRPELAVLLGYAKLALFDKLNDSKVPDDPYLENILEDYFPETMRQRFSEGIKGHRLRREIIATTLTNDVINRGGSTMVVRLAEETGHGESDIVYAFAAVQTVFGLNNLWARIDALDNKVPGAVQLDLYLEVQQLVRRQTAWFLRHQDFSAGLQEVSDTYTEGVKVYHDAIAGALTDRQRTFADARTKRYKDSGVPEELACEIAQLEFLADGPDAVLVAAQTGYPVAQVAAPFCQVDDYFRIGELRATAEAMKVTDYFDRLAINSTLSILTDAHRQLAVDVVNKEMPFEEWKTAGASAVARTKDSLDEILDGGELTLARLAVAASQARDLVPSLDVAISRR